MGALYSSSGPVLLRYLYRAIFVAFCFHCFLFKQPGRAEHFGYEVFTKEGFTDWKHASKAFKDHIGGPGSKHNSCVKHYDDYNNQRQSVASNFAISSKESEEMYKIRVM